MSRNEREWLAEPPLPKTHYVDTAIYTSEELFHEEREKIFNKVWIVACHESEIPNAYDYRTFRHPGGEELIILRGEDGKVRSFYNICPHRGNVLLYQPSGNAKRITCIFHQWSFDCTGNCIDIPRGTEGYQNRFDTGNAGLREVRAQVGFGGFVWVNVDDNAQSLEDYIGDGLSLLQE